MSGMRFSKLTVLYRSADRGRGKKPITKWVCQCDCGNLSTVRTACLLNGHKSSCGCRHKKHGYSHRERLYSVWENMRRRCFDRRNKRWNNYGGRGIRVCSEWNDYRVFREWALSHGYHEGLTIDRVDVNGDYSPENCRFADAKTQANNTTRNRYIEYNGTMYTMAQLADHLGLSYASLQHRIERGWSMERISSQPQRRR